MTIRNHLPWLLCLLLGASTAAAAQDLRDQGPLAGVLAAWVASASDNICGLRDLEQISAPSKVDFERCLAATPEMKRMKKEGIRLQSPEGIQLHTEAVDRVTQAANTVRVAAGHCSVWKAIEHSDGRSIPDLTSRVLGQY